MSSAPLAIIDTNVMFASINIADTHHARCRELLEGRRFELVVPMLCVAEVSHLVNRDLGAHVEAGFLESLGELVVEPPESSDWTRIAALVRRYADFPLGAVDASIVALAERLGVTTLFTLDRRHFGAIRPAHVESFTLLPE